MIRLFIALFKFAVIAIVVLIIGQIPIEKKRIFDHVRDFTSLPQIQQPIHWVSKQVDFTNGYTGVYKEENSRRGTSFTINQAIEKSRAPHPAGQFEHSRSDHEELSGILKRVQRSR